MNKKSKIKSPYKVSFIFTSKKPQPVPRDRSKIDKKNIIFDDRFDDPPLA